MILLYNWFFLNGIDANVSMMRFKRGEKSIMQRLLSAIEGFFFVHLVKHSTKSKQKADFPSCVKREGWNATTAAAHCSEQIPKIEKWRKK